jgi:predicted MFS family arabinose efflux permease
MFVARTFHNGVAHFSPWSRIAATALSHMTEHLYVGIITVILPAMATTLGLSMAEAGLLVSARSLVAGLSNLPAGLVAELTNRRSLVLGLCLVVLGSASLLMSFTANFFSLVLLMA